MKNFSIFKNNDRKSSTSPDYTVAVSIEGKFKSIGGCWIREGKNGKFFSCKLSDQYNERPGFHIEADEMKNIDPKVPYPEGPSGSIPF